MATRRISTLVMAVLGLIMLVGLFLPYIQSTSSPDLKISVFQVLGGEISDLIPAKNKTIYLVIGAAVAIGGLFALLSLTGKKVFGVFTIIASFLIAAFHGLLTIGFSEKRDIVAGLGFWLLLAASLVLFVTSIVFVARKPKLV
ncbi:hypothetical protein [Herpetosiphon sp. NSE202]|uniref:hypothetical protein n=1 Tax=Herpetosiphon sp. NSE202 TaxID=3351349 RepID=UPI003637CE01